MRELSADCSVVVQGVSRGPIAIWDDVTWGRFFQHSDSWFRTNRCSDWVDHFGIVISVSIIVWNPDFSKTWTIYLDSLGIWMVGPSEYLEFFVRIGVLGKYLRTETLRRRRGRPVAHRDLGLNAAKQLTIAEKCEVSCRGMLAGHVSSVRWRSGQGLVRYWRQESANCYKIPKG